MSAKSLLLKGITALVGVTAVLFVAAMSAGMLAAHLMLRRAASGAPGLADG